MELRIDPGFCDFPLVEYYEDEESWGLDDEPEEGYAVYRSGRFAIVIRR